MSKRNYFILSAATVALASWIGYSFYTAYQPQPMKLQGQIESQQYSVSSKVAGRIDQVLVRKGDMVKQGELIFTIHSPEIEAKLEQARARKSRRGTRTRSRARCSRTANSSR